MNINQAISSMFAAALLAFLGWLAIGIIDVRDRVSDLQATARENKEERIAQIAELRQRVYYLERREAK